MKHELKPDEVLDALVAEPERVRTYSHGNESGTLWEKVWKYDGTHFWSKVCASGIFVGWVKHTRESATGEMKDDFRIMQKS